MKIGAVVIALSLAFACPASAILRPRFPAKPSPPFRGQVIVIEDHASQPPRQ